MLCFKHFCRAVDFCRELESVRFRIISETEHYIYFDIALYVRYSVSAILDIFRNIAAANQYLADLISRIRCDRNIKAAALYHLVC